MKKVAVRKRNSKVTNIPNMGDDTRYVDVRVIPIPNVRTNANSSSKSAQWSLSITNLRVEGM